MKRIYFLLALALVVSCNRSKPEGRPVINLVSDIITDDKNPVHGLVTEYDAADPLKSIYVAGAPDRCKPILASLKTCDNHDNADGRAVSDGLPDFAGEVVCTILDFANTPYGSFLDAGREDDLREVTVRTVLSAMDTLCFINEFDKNGVATKPQAKVVVLASPCASAYGQFDVDSLFRVLDCNLPVVYPLRSMLDEVFDGRNTGAVVGVVAEKDSLTAGSYTSYVAENGPAGSDCVVLNTDPSAPDPLLAFLDSCLVAGKTRPFDAILVDDSSVDADAMRLTLKRITTAGNEESLSYGKLVAPGCRILDVMSTVNSECYRLLRKDNLFRLDIAYPRSIEYKTVATSDGTIVLTQYDDGDPLR